MTKFDELKREGQEKMGKQQPSASEDADTEAKMKYCMSWQKRDRKLIRAFKNCADMYKRDGRRENLLMHLDLIQRNSDGPMHNGALQLYQQLYRKEGGKNKEVSDGQRKMILSKKGISKNFEERLHMFASVELKAMKQACFTIERRRKQKDAAEKAASQAPTEEHARKAEVAAKEFELQLQSTTGMLEKIPEYDKLHEEALTQGLQYLATAF
ncbi:hypothetical protein RB195_004192 [Necator americanus]|uniref:F-BAR domain-containing protein n=1 Tax=Necator americanus TaxID=51031 RepID=A0ABR1BK96_NECAM